MSPRRRRTRRKPKEDASPRYLIADLEKVSPVRCSCGLSRRAFVSPDNPVATVHMVDIARDSQAHYHRRTTEIYLVVKGKGHMELDGRRVPVKPMTAVFIKPGCRHRAVGKLRIVNIPVPAHDPSDEFFE